MFKNLYSKMQKQNRVVILGSSGFVAKSLVEKLKRNNIPYLSISKKKINLTSIKSVKNLKKIISKKDVIVFISAKAPVKNLKMFDDNIKMVKNFIETLGDFKNNHIIYISSDAVYKDINNKINENSLTIPGSLHGIMHLTRELLLKSHFNNLCILRPTLIYGSKDPHNGYGPNQFIRLAKSNLDIKLFGNGEELRDHVWIEDVTKIVYYAICYKSIGILNIATGQVNSFYKIAKKIINLTKSKSKIIKLKRVGAMPHNGYRPFNSYLTYKTYPNFKYANLFNKLKLIHKEYKIKLK